ncbi:hypothetical protein C922_03873 [Plasmodium inui San Antonio 1]|uniref:Uncharacterized protein n=1 Tax=Plasmodium inui San Antonio 1 TaxID=1237626 RepID=W6ZXW1_9APIC|nr:hypothetical protein C922_03873 [Plasmodium inui San Antonio 1]EUD65627.1 hypothetical protein C922_03873 [Plasmodium inui San Antonio 1]
MSSNCSQENEDEANIIDGRFQNFLKLKARNGAVSNGGAGGHFSSHLGDNVGGSFSDSFSGSFNGSFNDSFSGSFSGSRGCNEGDAPSNTNNGNSGNGGNGSPYSNAASSSYYGSANRSTSENEETHGGGDLSNIKFSQNGQYKRYHDFYNNKNSLQHYLKKLKACKIDADELRNILEKRLALERENQMLKSIQDDDKKGGFGSETNSSSSNHEGLHLYRKLNFLNKNNRSKSKSKNRKRKRINSKIDKKFIIKCRTCKYVNPNGFKMGDYYTCQNCGYNDFSVLRSSSPNNGE